MKEIIKNLEEKLRLAMVKSDIEVLNELIADSLVFVGPDGGIATKQMDLEAHKSKLQRISEMIPSEQNILEVSNEIYVVTVKIKMKGYFADFNIDGTYRYLRVWKKFDDSYRIISGSVTKIV